MIAVETIYQTALELHRQAAIKIPDDARRAVERIHERESHDLSKYVLGQIIDNYQIAVDEQRPMCADTGLPRFFVKMGNEAKIEGGMVAMERALRQATADATASIPLRPNRVHPLTRKDLNNNVGVHAPDIDYSFEPGGEWLDLTVVHKGGCSAVTIACCFRRMAFPVFNAFFSTASASFFDEGCRVNP